MNIISHYLAKASCIASLLISSQVMAENYQIFLVRHAEKAATSPDPALSECGQQQATALAVLLKDVQLPHIYHTRFQRTQMTATALLQSGRTLQPFDPAHLTDLATQLKQNQQSAIVVGHSNTTPELAAILSEKEVASMSELEYGIIYQLSFSKNQLLVMNKLQLPQPSRCQK